MKVLVATALTQGAKAHDAMDCVEGEFVYLLPACPASRRRPFGPCRCGLTFRGMASDGLTTTAVVRDLPQLGLDAYIDCLDATHRFQRAAGCTCEFDALAEAWNMLAIAGSYPVGTVVERLIDRVQPRGVRGHG